MQKIGLNFIIDTLAFIAFLIVAKTGLIIFFFLPDGVQRGGYQEFWGITKNTYINIHDWSGIALIVLIVIHLVLHWQWACCSLKNLFKKDVCADIKE